MIKQFIPKNFCLSCKGCCRFSQSDSVWTVRLLANEKDKFFRQHGKAIVDKKGQKFRLKPLKDKSGFFCPFLCLKNNTCAVYRKRPFECMLYPFVLSRKGPKVFLCADANCRFVAGNMAGEDFKEYCRYLSGCLKRPYYISLLRKNPHIIQQYPGVEYIEELRLNNISR